MGAGEAMAFTMGIRKLICLFDACAKLFKFSQTKFLLMDLMGPGPIGIFDPLTSALSTYLSKDSSVVKVTLISSRSVRRLEIVSFSEEQNSIWSSEILCWGCLSGI